MCSPDRRSDSDDSVLLIEERAHVPTYPVLAHSNDAIVTPPPQSIQVRVPQNQGTEGRREVRINFMPGYPRAPAPAAVPIAKGSLLSI